MTEQKFERVEEITKRLFGMDPHKVTVSRWHLDGCRGKKLEIVKVNGRIMSTEQWVIAFFKNDPTVVKPKFTKPKRTSKVRTEAYEKSLLNAVKQQG